MSNVLTFDKNARLRSHIAKAAETAGRLAASVQDPATRTRLQAKALELAARARAL